MPSMRQIAALPAILLFLLLLSAVTPAVASEGWDSGTTQGAGVNPNSYRRGCRIIVSIRGER